MSAPSGDSSSWGLLASSLTALGTLLLAAVAAFQDKIRAHFFQPEFEITVNVEPPDCHKTELNDPRTGQHYADCYYFRARVKNIGKYKADLVEVYGYDLTKRAVDKTFRHVKTFLPMNFRWSHIGTPVFSSISREMEKFLDIGHIVKPSDRSKIPGEDDSRLRVSNTETLFSFDQEVKAFTLGYLIPPGYYRLKIKVGAANARILEKTIEIDHTGKWFDDEEKMLTEGISIAIR